MKKVTINVLYDNDKLSALRLYLGQKNSSVESELVSSLDVLYGKTVPSNVREFLEMSTGITGKQTEKKNKQKYQSSAPERSEVS